MCYYFAGVVGNLTADDNRCSDVTTSDNGASTSRMAGAAAVGRPNAAAAADNDDVDEHRLYSGILATIMNTLKAFYYHR